MCWNEWKINFQIYAIFSFWDIGIFVLKTVNFRWIFTTTRKIKIIKYIFHSIQHIAHLSLGWEQNLGGHLHILSWEISQFWNKSIYLSIIYVYIYRYIYIKSISILGGRLHILSWEISQFWNKSISIWPTSLIYYIYMY